MKALVVPVSCGGGAESGSTNLRVLVHYVRTGEEFCGGDERHALWVLVDIESDIQETIKQAVVTDARTKFGDNIDVNDVIIL